MVWGVGFDETLGNKVKITILAAGFDVTLRDDEADIINGGGGFMFDLPKPGGNKINVKPTVQTPAVQPTVPGTTKLDQRMADEYGQDKVQEITGAKDRSNSIILGMNQLDDEGICEILERHPTYKRDRKIVEAVRSSAVDTSQSSPLGGATNAVFSY